MSDRELKGIYIKHRSYYHLNDLTNTYVDFENIKLYEKWYENIFIILDIKLYTVQYLYILFSMKYMDIFRIY